MALTDKEILALKPMARKYKVFDDDGLFLVVHPRGGRYWYLKCHIDSRPHEVAFGTYPTVTLKLAREKRDDARQQLARGLNPKLEKKASKAARAILFEDVAEEWVRLMSRPVNEGDGEEFKAAGGNDANVASRAALDPATIKKHRWLLDTYLNTAVGKWPIAQISAQQLLPLLKRIEQEGKRDQLREGGEENPSGTDEDGCSAHRAAQKTGHRDPL